jgi:HNH endonuclease
VRLTFCAACGTTQDLQHHHLLSRPEGGSDAETNLVTLCCDCHLKVQERRRGDYIASARVMAKARGVMRANADQRASNLAVVLDGLRAEGITSANAMAGALNARGVASARGGRWTARGVLNVLARLQATGHR